MPDDISDVIFALTNAARVEAGRPALTRHGKLMSAARDYATLMSKMDQSGHNVGGQNLKERLTAVGYVWRSAGENVAWNPRLDEQHVMKQWMNSDRHRRNLLKPNYTEIGIGVAGPSARGRWYYCQIFGRPRVGSNLLDTMDEAEEASSSIAEDVGDGAE